MFCKSRNSNSIRLKDLFLNLYALSQESEVPGLQCGSETRPLDDFFLLLVNMKMKGIK